MRKTVLPEMIFGGDSKWYRAIFNAIALEWNGVVMPKKVKIKDETLREGEETPGVKLSVEDKLKVAYKLIEMGIEEVEVGYCGAIKEHYDLAKVFKKEGLNLKLSSHIRAYAKGDSWKYEIEKGLESGADIINLLAKASDSQLALSPWLKKEDIPSRVYDTVSYSKKCGAYTAFGLADPARTNMEYVISCYEAAYQAGADRLYIYDGPGCASPEAIEYLTKLVRAISGGLIEIAVHCHNDFGLATANSIAAVKGGAAIIDTVINGLGDRAGNAPFEEVVCALEVLYDVRTGIDITKITEVSDLVSQIYKVPVAPNKAIIGNNCYRHVSDSHVATLLRGSWDSFEVIRAEALGKKRSLEFGATTIQEGEGALTAKIESMGYKATKDLVDLLRNKIREKLVDREFIDENEVESLINELVK
jgi:isopropylmalate/homocitrate/citramalate synthase